MAAICALNDCLARYVARMTSLMTIKPKSIIESLGHFGESVLSTVVLGSKDAAAES